MGKLYIDETAENAEVLYNAGFVIGAVEVLPPGLPRCEKLSVSARELSRAAVADFDRRRTEEKNLAFIREATLSTSALCTVCANDTRFCGSVFCKSCIGRKAAAARISRRFDLFDYEISGRDYLTMCLLTGLLVFFIVKLGAPRTAAARGFGEATVNSTE